MKLPIKTALLWILASTVLFSGSVFGLTRYFCKNSKSRLQDPRFAIVAIIQTGPEKEALKSSYLAELMDLSCDRKVNLFAFDVKAAEEKLLLSPLIKSAKVKRLRPGTLYVDYEIRHPIAKLQDYENTGIDAEGHIFPLQPFFAKSHLPEVYLGLVHNDPEKKEINWHEPIKGKYLTLAFQLLQYMASSPCKEAFRLKSIDVSKAFHPSYGRREIVICVEEALRLQSESGVSTCIFSQLLRMNPKDYDQEISNFLVLREKMLKDYQAQLKHRCLGSSIVRFSPRVIDFRIPELAFIKEE